MKRFQNVLVLAGNENDRSTLQRAVSIVKHNGARLTVIDVIDLFAGTFLLDIDGDVLSDMREQLIERRRSGLENLVNEFRQELPQIASNVLFGERAIETIREVLRNKHDLVLKSADQPGGLREMLFGTTAMQLMRKCTCPVWVTKAGTEMAHGVIVAAVDPVVVSDAAKRMNARILDIASSLAEMEQVEMHVVHAWNCDFVDSVALSQDGSSSDEDTCEITRAVEAELRHRLDELIAPLGLNCESSTVHLLRGDPGSVLPLQAKELNAEIVVMGTVCRTGVSGFLIGGTAERILQQINCSVLTVKPDDFVTPVQLDDPETGTVEGEPVLA